MPVPQSFDPRRVRAQTARTLRASTSFILAVGAAVCALVLPAGAASPPTAPISIEVERDGDRFFVSARADLHADARTAWDTLTDYERLPDFVPGVTRTRVLARDRRAGAERLTVEYDGVFKLLFIALPTRVWLDVQHAPFTEVLARSSAGGVDRPAPTLKAFRSRYGLAVVGGRAGSVPVVRLEYSARFELAEPLPPVLGTLFGTSAVRHSVREQFTAMVAEIERRSRDRPSIHGSKARDGS